MSTSTHRAPRRARAIAQVIGSLVGFLCGIVYGAWVTSANPGILGSSTAELRTALIAIAIAGSASFALAAPIVTVDVFVWLVEFLDTAPAGDVVGAVVGLIAALAISAFVAIVLSPLPMGIGLFISVPLACCLSYIGVRTGRRRRHHFSAALGSRTVAEDRVFDSDPEPQDGAPIVVDTSSLIDGRIVDVAKTGFIQGRLIIPSFVLEELQRVADSGDSIKRARGRRGLGMVDTLRAGRDVAVEVLEVDFPGTPEVDARLVKLARVRGAALITQDYNLNRLAQAEGLRVLNLNELANAVKPIASAGEVLRVTIVKEGKEPNQGVGYLDDGTMVVVENGRNRIDETVTATVSSVLQTAAGRMIFAQVQAGDDRPSRRQRPDPRAAGGS